MNKSEKSERSEKLRIFFNGLANKQKKMTIEEIEMCSEICMIIIQYYAFLDLPNKELMEKIISEVNFVKSLDGEDEEYLKDKLCPLLQSRRLDGDTAKWMDRVHELEIENARLREQQAPPNDELVEKVVLLAKESIGEPEFHDACNDFDFNEDYFKIEIRKLLGGRKP